MVSGNEVEVPGDCRLVPNEYVVDPPKLEVRAAAFPTLQTEAVAGVIVPTGNALTTTLNGITVEHNEPADWEAVSV